jgi:hypothetical protein
MCGKRKSGRLRAHPQAAAPLHLLHASTRAPSAQVGRRTWPPPIHRHLRPARRPSLLSPPSRLDLLRLPTSSKARCVPHTDETNQDEAVVDLPVVVAVITPKHQGKIVQKGPNQRNSFAFISTYRYRFQSKQKNAVLVLHIVLGPIFSWYSIL